MVYTWIYGFSYFIRNFYFSIISVSIVSPVIPVIKRLAVWPMHKLLVDWSFYGDQTQISSYDIQAKEIPTSAWKSIMTGPINLTSTRVVATISTLKPDTNYYIRVALIQMDHSNIISKMRSVRTLIGIPQSYPRDIKVIRIDQSTVDVRWKVNIKNPLFVLDLYR